MGTNNASVITYRKIGSTKRSFFDLPGEVRDSIYKEYFTLPHGRFTIHLLSISLDEDESETDHARCVLSQYPELVQPDELEDEEFDISSIRDYQSTLRTSLLRTARAVYHEASIYVNRIKKFKIISGECGLEEVYHSEFQIIEPDLLVRIKDLEIGDCLEHSCFDIEEPGWVSGIWPLIVTQMTGLERVTISGGEVFSVFHFFAAFSLPQAIFLGRRPDFYLDGSQDIPIDYPEPLPTKLPEATNALPRLIMPPLRSVTWIPYISENNLNTLKGIDFRGWRLVEVPATGITQTPQEGIIKRFQLVSSTTAGSSGGD